MVALLLFALFPLIIGGGIIVVKFLDQRRRDRRLVTYRLSFPINLSTDTALEWVKSISGTLRSPSARFVGSPTMAFEMWATNEGITHLIKVPWEYKRYVVSHLQLAGIRVDTQDNPPHRQWLKAVEVRLKGSSRTLLIDSASAQAARMLKSVQPLLEKEAVCVQWVITPAPRMAAPTYENQPKSHEFGFAQLFKGAPANRDEITERRKKLEEPNMLAVLRVAAVASTEGKAESLIFDVRRTLAATETSSTKFEKRLVHRDDLQRRIDNAAGPVLAPMQLSASELLAFMGWPLESPYVAGISPTLSRHFPPSANIPIKGLGLGTANMPGAEREIAVSFESSVRHMHIIGRTGTGKSTLMENLMAKEMANGNGVILIEAKGQLFEAVLHRIPKERINDVIIIDINDTQRPVGFNVLDQGNSRTAIDELISLVTLLYKDTSQSVYAPQILYHVMHALDEVPGSTFTDLPAILRPATSEEGLWRENIVRQLRDAEIKQYMADFVALKDRDRDTRVAPVYNRTWQFTSRPEIRNIIGQRTSSFKMTDVIRDNQILLVNLGGSQAGDGTAGLIGTFLVNAVWGAVRQVTPAKPNFIHLDEFEDFTRLPVNLESILAKARSAGLGARLAHQNLVQLPSELRSSVMANTATKIVFRISSEDARVMGRDLGRIIEDRDLSELPDHDAIALVATDSGSSPPVSITTKPPGKSTGLVNEVRELSRQKYGRPIEEVKRELTNRKAPERPRRSKPRISGDGWG